MKKHSILITAAIDYINAKPHVGHALEKIQADVLARFEREKPDHEVYYLWGSDENSLKNVQSAQKAGIPVQEYVDKAQEDFTKLKEDLNLSLDQFTRTTEKKHFLGAQKLWRAFRPEDIYKKNYTGYYCVGCEEFKLERDLIDGKCPDHSAPLQKVDEENYFFKLSNYQDQLKTLIQKDQIKILPEFRKNEMLAFIESGLDDFSISRSVKRAENWGVPIPGDSEQIMYVWVDALSNYITALDYATEGELYKKFWVEAEERIHVIGKGILRFHAIYWPAMLLSAGLKLPTEILSHEYLTIDGKKMSKSIGNVIDPEDLVRKYGVDGTRYLLLSSLPYNNDGDLTWDKMTEKFNADLANGIGNLLQRTLNMINKYEIKITRKEDYYEGKEYQEADEVPQTQLLVNTLLPELKLEQALQEIWRLIKESNIYIDEKKPWELAKNSEAIELTRVLTVLYWQIWDIAKLLAPFMPETSAKILGQLENKKPEALFMRINA